MHQLAENAKDMLQMVSFSALSVVAIVAALTVCIALAFLSRQLVWFWSDCVKKERAINEARGLVRRE
jgi:uncharacterized membrane protein